MTIPDATVSGSLMQFALVVAGSLILILSSLLWYFVKDRIQFSMKERDVLYKKLSEGSERMKCLDRDVAVLKERIPERDFLRNMDTRLVNLEARLEHMNKLLATLVEIRNASD